MRLSISLVLTCGAFLTSAYPRPHRLFSRLIVFGDSFSDNGNGAWVASNGTWPVDPAYFNHSFSNGPKWNDIAADVLDLELINLATGGATTDNDFVAGGTGASSTIPVPSADDQITAFLSRDKPTETDVFVLWIGANDILFNTSITGIEVTSLISKHVNRLYRAGIQNLILANYNNATTFPATYNSSDYNIPSVQAFAGDLTIGLIDIAAGYSGFFRTAFVDIGALFLDIMERPTRYNIDQKYVDPPTACLTEFCTMTMASGFHTTSDEASKALKENITGRIIIITGLDRVEAARVRKAAGELSAYVDAIDAIICTAGVMALPSYQKSKNGIEVQFAVNYLGHFLFINLLVDKRLAGDATVVTYTSEAHTRADLGFPNDLTYSECKTYEKWTAYSNSKACDILLSVGLVEKFGKRGLRSFSVDPGIIVSTSLPRSVPQEDFQAMGWVDENGNLNSALKIKTLDEGAATGIIAAFDRRISRYFLADGALTERGLLPAAVDPTIAAKLWSIREKLIK
ncbi:Hypothetical protein NCS54_01233200 [Fusarium falciforme]|uniref:Hypothetical protein n=1 Tax=Fusarium falciforme TaxID=195108 RepID=UPI002300C7B4|nr:Hypothetical protein NCS54_01233200 [Fusarium falciforme]WAO94734.1 Hypothetical protein NCS54_01233200 [Fusarium falciforme]